MGRPRGRPRGSRKRFCKRGHDTITLGRDKNFYCKECRRENDRRRDPKRRALEARKTDRAHKKIQVSEWERARVQRWYDIVADDPIVAEFNGTLARAEAFAARYERLEAAVPTPETVDA